MVENAGSSAVFPSMDPDTYVPGMPAFLSLPQGPDLSTLGPISSNVNLDILGSTLSHSEPKTLDTETIELVQAALKLTSSLQIPEALSRLVDSACSLTGAAWGTIAVEDRSAIMGHTLDDLTAGSATVDAAHLTQLIGDHETESEVIIANDLMGSSPFTGAIEGEEPGSILSAPLRVHDTVYGRLYLCDKPGGFGQVDISMVTMLAESAAVAVENARLYRAARSREQWMAVSQELTQTLLSGASEDDALILIARRVREVAYADIAALILPSVGDTWVCEIAEGEGGAGLIGTIFHPEGRALRTLDLQTGLTIPSFHQAWLDGELRIPALADYGPALYAPMIHRGTGVGVMLLLRGKEQPAFTEQDLEIAELVAAQATVAFELADAQHAEEVAMLLGERSRIARDLHDLAIQQLFATGMQISSTKERLKSGQEVDAEQLGSLLDRSLAAVDDSVRQIRTIVRSLRDRDEEVGFIERLRREASLARTALGFAPSLLISVDGLDLSDVPQEVEDEVISIVDASLDQEIADDMVAVVRESLSNVARHAHASSVSVDVHLCGIRPHQQDCDQEDAGPTAIIVCNDDGVGIGPEVTRSSGTGNLAERARRHGGEFQMSASRPHDREHPGTRLLWRVPLDSEASESTPI